MSTPVKITLEANKSYHFCTCGKSKDKVLCDGSHQRTSFTPTEFSVEKTGEYYLCGSKKSGNLPFCDGSHSK
jgi:CDGSH-type Zn-finger protein